ncbi:MAG: damage-inducible protein CinA [Candidatus Marinimicrobia bacterium]|nr:damage-inducible protein CinA [Candidatus Neomarinimicrobiota bacterium]|tara:strand:- start:203 stop:1495 length:1293 start_codon:yes stop_codon:yes gene_type:complete
MDAAMRVGIITIGNELLSGFTLDRNAAWIGQQLLTSGIKVNVHHTIPDDFDVIYDTLEYQFKEWRCDQIIVTGGLGPTVDDITVSSFLEYFDDSHEFDKEYWEILSERFKKLNFKMPNLNKNQAYKSKRGIMIPNLVGTARGLHYTKKHDSVLRSVKGLITGDKNRVNFFALPGVPKEMKSMFTNYVLPEIEKSLKNKVICKSIRTTGVPESILQEKITDIIDANKEKCDVAFLPHRMLGVDIRLTSSDNQLVEDLINSIVPRIKKYVYGYDNDKLEQVIADLLIQNNLTVSTAESCTSGLLASRLTDVPGSSKYFKGGSVCYSNELKINDIGVDKDLIERYGAVSEEVAESLAKNIAQKNNTDIGIGITGIAGPDGGTEKKPVGLVFVGIFYKNNLYIKRYNLTPDRITNRELTVTLCLNEIRKILRNS